MRKMLMSLLSCLALSGCFYDEAPYPSEGAGGFAEWDSIPNHRARSLHDRMAYLRQRGAATYEAGALAEAELLLTRCRRELAAGLYLDADASMDRLERQLAAMEARLARRAGARN